MSYDAPQRTIAARVAACTARLPALIAARGLPPLAEADDGAGALAVYPSAVAQYASPCVEVLQVEGPVHANAAIRISELSGDIILSFQSTDSPLPMADMAAGYLGALVEAFSDQREGADEYWEVTNVSMSPTMASDDLFIKGVAVTVMHQIAEPLKNT